MTGKRILVTGSCGYLGTVLVPILQFHGHGVFEVDRKLNLDVDDIREDYVKQFDTVIHLAAETDVMKCQREMTNTFEENCNKTMRLEKKLLPGQHFIFASSSAVYGDAQGRSVWWDDTNPTTIYALSKLMAENIIRHENTVIIRLATLWGLSPCPRKNMFIPDAIDEMKKTGIALCYDPVTKRPYMNVKDAADSIVWIVENHPFEKLTWVNAGTETLRKIDVIRTLAKRFGIEQIRYKSTKFIQDFIMSTWGLGKRFIEFYEEAM